MSSFTATEYILAACILALLGVVTKMAHHIHGQAQDRLRAQLGQAEAARKAEVEAVEKVLPLVNRILDVAEQQQRILERIPDIDALVQDLRDASRGG